MSIFNELYMTSLATGHSPVLDKDIKSLSPPTIFTKSKSPPPWSPKVCPVAETELCFFQTVNSSRGATFHMFFIPVNHNPLATCFATLLGGYSLDSFKSNFTNTPISQQMDVDLVPGVG